MRSKEPLQWSERAHLLLLVAEKLYLYPAGKRINGIKASFEGRSCRRHRSRGDIYICKDEDSVFPGSDGDGFKQAWWLADTDCAPFSRSDGNQPHFLSSIISECSTHALSKIYVHTDIHSSTSLTLLPLAVSLWKYNSPAVMYCSSWLLYKALHILKTHHLIFSLYLSFPLTGSDDVIADPVLFTSIQWALASLRRKLSCRPVSASLMQISFYCCLLNSR